MRGAALALAAAAALLVSGLSAPPAVAAPGWLPAADLSAPGRDAEEPGAAVDAEGNAVAVWSRSNGSNTIVQAATRPAGGSWTAPAPLSVSGRDATEPQVAVDPRGNAVAVWTRLNGSNTIVQAATRPAGGTWSGAMDLSASGRNASEPQVAIDPQGRAVAVWRRTDGLDFIVQSSSLAPGGSWSLPDDLSEEGEDAEGPQVVMDASGNALAVWSRHDGSDFIVQSGSLAPGGSWSPPVDLSVAGEDASEPQVAVDAAGNAVAVWVGSAGSDEVIQASSRPFGGAWSEALDLTTAGDDPEAPQVATAAGRAVAVWAQAKVPPTVVIQASVRSGGGSWQGPDDLSAGGISSAESPQVGVDPSGNAVAVWARSAASPTVVEGAMSPPGAPWSPPDNLSVIGNNAIEPQLSLDPTGDGVAVWSRENGANAIVQAAGLDRAGPQLRSLVIPDAGTLRQRVRLSVAPFDVWSGAREVTWQFGDGGSAAGSEVEHTYFGRGPHRVTVSAVDALGNVSEAAEEITIFQIASAGRFARVRRGRALLRLRCPSPAGCSGVARLIAGATLRRQGRRVRRRVQIGRAAFSIPGQEAVTLPVRLTRRGKGLARGAGRRGLRTQLTGPGVRHRVVILLPSAPARRQRRQARHTR